MILAESKEYILTRLKIISVNNEAKYLINTFANLHQ